LQQTEAEAAFVFFVVPITTRALQHPLIGNSAASTSAIHCDFTSVERGSLVYLDIIECLTDSGRFTSSGTTAEVRIISQAGTMNSHLPAGRPGQGGGPPPGVDMGSMSGPGMGRRGGNRPSYPPQYHQQQQQQQPPQQQVRALYLYLKTLAPVSKG